MIPGLMRIFIFDEIFCISNNNNDNNRSISIFIVKLDSLLSNFLLILSVILRLEFQYSHKFGNYKDWMKDVTYLLSRLQTDKIEMSQLFLSLKKRSNILGWLELRSFLAIEGKYILANKSWLDYG